MTAVHDLCGETWVSCVCDPATLTDDDYRAYWSSRYHAQGRVAPMRQGSSGVENHRRDERERALVLGLVSAYARSPHRVVEYGCGPARLLRAFPGEWDVRGFEPTPPAAAIALSDGFNVVSDALELPESWAEVVYTFTCLQHVPDHQLEAAIGHIRRAVARHGHVVMVENTTARDPDKPWVRFRSPALYESFFPDSFVRLGAVDLPSAHGETHSIIVLRAP